MSDTSDPNPSIELEAEDKSGEKSSYDEKESSGADPLQISENPDLNTYLEPADKESVLTVQRIEDEDPPTFYSVSSTTKNESEEKVKSIDQESVPVKEDLNRRESSDKDDDDSVCVVDSSSEEDADDDEDDDEETEESEEEDDEYSNSKTHRNKKHQEDDDNEEEYIKHASRAYRKTVENEDDDEEYEEDSQGLRFQEQNDYEGDEDFDEEDEDDYDEDRFEPEHFEGNSDDCVLRYNSNNGLNYGQKERSHSLQDVSSIKGRNTRNKNVNPFSQKARFERRMFDNENCAQVSKQYHNQDDKMCADDSLDEREDIKKFKQSQDIRDKTVEESDERSRNSEIIKVCKSMKEYAEKTVKEVEIDDFEENNGIRIMSHPVENGEVVANQIKNNFNNKERNCDEMEIELSDAETYKNDCKINGTTIILNNEKPVNKKGISRADGQSILLNGEEESKPYTTTRNLSYDEYMRGTNESISSFGVTNYDQQLQNVPNHSLVNNYEEQEKLITLTKHLNDATIQLHQRNADYKNLSADYKNIISQNVELKNELENLKKLLIHYERQTKSKNKSASTSAQTETIENTNSKVNSSTQWSDDAKPPKSKYSFSHAFVTSSKIIQTLSNVTQRTKSYDMKSGKVSKAAGSDLEIDDYELVQDSKKRKATSFNLKELSKSAHPSKKYNMTDQESMSKDNLETDECNDNDEIKVFIYPEHGTGKDQSFLIQAKEIGDNIKPGRRECGPFLLGNIEVRMAEVNGTINIWGKEVVQEATSFIEELDSKISKSSSYWQSIPESKIFNTSSKKLRPDDTDSSHPCKSKKIERHNYCTKKNQSLQDSHYSCCVGPKPSNYHECHQVHNPGCCNSHLESRRLSLPSRNKNLHCCCKQECSKFAHQPINIDNESDDEVEITVCERKQCQINEKLYSNDRAETIGNSINEGNRSKNVRGLLLDMLGPSTLSNRNPSFPRATTSQLTTSSPYEKRYSHNEVKNLETQLEQFQREVEKIKSRSDTLRDMITTLHEGKRN